MERTFQKRKLPTTAAQQIVKAIVVPGVVITIATTVHGTEARLGNRLTRTKPFELNFQNQK